MSCDIPQFHFEPDSPKGQSDERIMGAERAESERSGPAHFRKVNEKKSLTSPSGPASSRSACCK
jgi:hypothetical protein